MPGSRRHAPLVVRRLRDAGVPSEHLARLHSPVGLDLGGRSAEEIALSIMAAVVRAIRLEGLVAPTARDASSGSGAVVDPVCGMTVVVGPDTPTAVIRGVTRWFCGPGCRDDLVAAASV
ncbi:MAG TPA: XdhC family protein, partial [Iamia sp.]